MQLVAGLQQAETLQHARNEASVTTTLKFAKVSPTEVEAANGVHNPPVAKNGHAFGHAVSHMCMPGGISCTAKLAKAAALRSSKEVVFKATVKTFPNTELDYIM
eukprot:3499991-Amphidinium_carterae.2